MTTVASGRWTSAPEPVASAIGTNPSDATSAVIRTGLIRRPHACRSTSAIGKSVLSSRSRIWVTRTTPLSTATPKSAMKPTPAEIENGSPRTTSAKTPPVAANGTFR